MPASLTSATVSPACIRFTSRGSTSRGVVFVISQQRTFDLIARQQLGGDARVLAGDDVGLAKRVEGAQRDIAEIADRRGDDEKSPPALARFT